ncbi:carbohydrate-binding protein [Paraoerskovia sediminicola]|nr:carbohydrate-binding protein [Paraoerskovia sediminicola]
MAVVSLGGEGIFAAVINGVGDKADGVETIPSYVEHYVTEGPTEPAHPAWDASAVYLTGDLVTVGDRVFRASWWTQNQEPGLTAYGPWEEIATTDDGTAVWTASRVFVSGDVVEHDGATYRAKWWTRNQAPGDQWGPWELLG